MGKEAAGVHLRGLGAMLGSPGQGHLAPPMGPQRVVAGQPLACPMPEQGAKLTLAEEANSHRKPLEAGAGPPHIRAPWEKNASWDP